MIFPWILAIICSFLFLSLFLGRRLTSNTKNRMPKQLELGISMSSYHRQPEALRKAINLIIMNYFNKHQLNTGNMMGNVIGTILLTLTIPRSLFLRTVSVKGWGWILCLILNWRIYASSLIWLTLCLSDHLLLSLIMIINSSLFFWQIIALGT